MNLLLTAAVAAILGGVGEEPASNLNLRGSLDNARIKFERDGVGTVAFMGGSITEMNGYRPMVCADLQERFPDCKFKFIDAGISSTCSTTGAFRLQRDVLSRGPVDLFFVEFAVNDDQDAAHARRESIRGMEGILRHCREANPLMDVVVVHFTNPGMVEKLRGGETPTSIAAHEVAAEHYQVSSVNLARELAQRIEAGTFTWQKFGGTHPAPAGNRLTADLVKELLQQAWARPLGDNPDTTPHPIPEKPLDEQSYFAGLFVSPDEATAEGWQFHTPDWKSLPGNCRTRFVKQELLTADKPGSELTLKFTGRGIGAYVLAGPDAGVVEVSIDGGNFSSVNLYHRHSRGLHYPRTVMLASDLEPGEHTLRLRVSEATDARSRGNAVRILQFGVN